MIAFELNGTAVRSDAAPATRLSEVLRGQLGQMGTKSGCDAGDCGGAPGLWQNFFFGTAADAPAAEAAALTRPHM